MLTCVRMCVRVCVRAGLAPATLKWGGLTDSPTAELPKAFSYSEAACAAAYNPRAQCTQKRPIFYLSRSSSRSIWLHLALVSCTVALNTDQDRAHHLAWPAVRETNSQELVDIAIVRGRGRGEDRTGPGHRHEIYCSAGLPAVKRGCRVFKGGGPAGSENHFERYAN